MSISRTGRMMSANISRMGLANARLLYWLFACSVRPEAQVSPRRTRTGPSRRAAPTARAAHATMPTARPGTNSWAATAGAAGRSTNADSTSDAINAVAGAATSPRATHATANAATAASSGRPASWACSASGLRGNPRKATPNALTKHASVRAAVSASAPPASSGTTADGDAPSLRPRPKRAWSVSHSLAKPLSGGPPEMAALPTNNTSVLHGIYRSLNHNPHTTHDQNAVTTHTP